MSDYCRFLDQTTSVMWIDALQSLEKYVYFKL